MLSLLQIKNFALIDNLTVTFGSGLNVLTGKTGAGKTTVLDIAMGLLKPTGGKLLVDGIEIDSTNIMLWQSQIAHVPQSIFLSDNSILENIAFGTPRSQIDLQQVKRVAHQAMLDGVIESWPLKYETVIGERGVRLSGGQRQRVGIARALYKKASVIILDEATSALDSQTEEEIMSAINRLQGNITMLIVAHRVSTLKSCDFICEIGNGIINRKGSFAKIVDNNN